MIISVPSNVTEAVRHDILFSLLTAQLGADHVYNRNSMVSHWLGSYSTTLEYLFWKGTVQPLTSLSISQSSFTISDVALQMMKKQTNMIQAVPIFTKIFDTLKNRPESDKAIKIIANRTTTSTHETTQLFCYVTNYVFANYDVKDKSSWPLSHLYKTNEVKHKSHMFYLQTFNELSYASQLRQAVIDKLGGHIKTDITQIY